MLESFAESKERGGVFHNFHNSSSNFAFSSTSSGNIKLSRIYFKLSF